MQTSALIVYYIIVLLQMQQTRQRFKKNPLLAKLFIYCIKLPCLWRTTYQIYISYHFVLALSLTFVNV